MHPSLSCPKGARECNVPGSYGPFPARIGGLTGPVMQLTLRDLGPLVLVVLLNIRCSPESCWQKKAEYFVCRPRLDLLPTDACQH